MKSILLNLISLYQRTISPDHGVFSHTRLFSGCRFYPSCSEYAKKCIKRDGVVNGVWKSAKRIARCNPYSSGGVDMP